MERNRVQSVDPRKNNTFEQTFHIFLLGKPGQTRKAGKSKKGRHRRGQRLQDLGQKEGRRRGRRHHPDAGPGLEPIYQCLYPPGRPDRSGHGKPGLKMPGRLAGAQAGTVRKQYDRQDSPKEQHNSGEALQGLAGDQGLYRPEDRNVQLGRHRQFPGLQDEPAEMGKGDLQHL